MASVFMDDKVFNREVSFCKVYSLESKQKLEKLFLQNRISYFIEWQDKSFISRLLGGDNQKEKTVYIIRINEADVERATQLVKDLDSVKIRKVKED